MTQTPPLTPEVATAPAAARPHDAAQQMLVHYCATCKAGFRGHRRRRAHTAPANTHGKTLTPRIEAALAA